MAEDPGGPARGRPRALDYIATLITDFVPLAGDRAFGEDAAIVGGMGRFDGRSVMVLGTEKGSETESRVRHNFGSAKPEGYRKARRLIELAGRFALPLLTFVDTSGAFPGIDAEARGQAEAIARSTMACLDAPVPIVATIIGEGGSGGAIALAAGDRVLMLEHAVYSVISPEGCASICGGMQPRPQRAAEAQKLTAADLKALHLIDVIVAEPLGGAHRDPGAGDVGRRLGDRRGPGPGARPDAGGEGGCCGVTSSWPWGGTGWLEPRPDLLQQRQRVTPRLHARRPGPV